MEYLQALILGIIEGLTEFLPVSSTAHLLWAEKLFGLPENSFWKSFSIFIQLGAISAVFVLYFKKLFKKETVKNLILAFLPTALIGFSFYSLIKGNFFSNYSLMAWALLLGGLLMLFLEKMYLKKEKEISPLKAFLIGVFQSLAIIPGVSRSAATILGGLGLGIKRSSIVEFSFLLAVPTIFAASLWDLKSSSLSFSSQEIYLLLIGLISSFLVSWLVIKAFLRYIQKYDFRPFAWYRIAIAIIFLLILNL